ncbi:MAG: substrate-binding domain-containing protein [Planctomycetes bacterium]|nr:substrate-binding domain-containing protein [Planctomycetota bacterium]
MKPPAKRVPHIGLLFWSPEEIHQNYCPDLFLPYKEAAARGLLTYKYLTPRSANDFHPPLEQVKAGRFDGLVSVSIWKETFIGDLQKLGLPMVTLDYRSNGWPADSVTFGSRQAFSQIAQLFKENDHREILFISVFRPQGVAHGKGDTYIEDDTSLERRMALQEALADSDVDMWPLLPIKTGPGVRREALVKALKDLITNIGKAPTAITGHDINIVGYGRQALEDLKLRVPQDVSLISVDALNTETQPAKKITMDTLKFSWKQVGTEGLRMLWERMSGKVPADVPPRHIELAGTYLPAGTMANRRKVPPG